MKIMFLLNDLSSGGAERVTTTLANHWAQAGHDVVLVTMAQGDDFYALDPRVDRRRLYLAAPSRSLATAVAGGLRRVIAVRGLLRALKPDVAIAMMTSWNVELALAAFGLPVVAVGSERIYPPSLPLGRVWETLRRWVYGSLDAVVAQTEASRNWLLTHTKARRVYVVPNPIPAFGDAVATPFDEVAPGTPLLLAVGRLVRQKRFDRVIDAFVSEQAALSGWHLVIVGEGELRADLLRQAVDAGLADRVHLPGSSTAIESWYRRAALFVLASDFEGFPNVLLEAMAHGMPSIAVDCPSGPAELIEDGRNGLIVTLGNQPALARALARLAQDDALRRRLGDAARRDTVEKYSAGRIASQWEAVFASAKKAQP